MKSQLFLILSLFVCAGLRAQQRHWVVAQNGPGDFKTVQAALDKVPPNNRQPISILIRNGVYREKLHLDSTKDRVTLIGEDRFRTILTYDDHPGMTNPAGDSINTRNSYSFRIRGNDFLARNITFRNDAGFAAGQAVALEVQGDRAQFIDCRIIGNQDILFLNSEKSRQFYSHCYIEGTTDFIFGAATAWFDQCHIHSKKNSHVTAASTPRDHPFGFVFYDCTLTGDSTIRNASLGRPWRPYASVTYIHCYIDRHIRAGGWSDWNNTDSYKTARFAEYEDFGPGAATASRVPWSRQLSDVEVGHYSMEALFGDWQPGGSARDH
ncbi:MAG: pectinesterase family protein [Bacteroidota bacterium]|nr:pectinesterase family protein [Bacteroidota bacterium]MDP4214604.1 pectinesterase family protein [Bacteroidota bacterium]MDP4247364.1 pectinesterase family protein [Bacteroidota bacterium]MDP4257908.1 pectinesterase family protein [Bacteroidota bacterium]